MPKKSPKLARKVSEPRAKEGKDIPQPPIEAGHSVQGKAAEAGKDAPKLPAEDGVVFPYSFELVAATTLHFYKPDACNVSGALTDAIRHLDFVWANFASVGEGWCERQRFKQALKRAPEETDFLSGVAYITGTRKVEGHKLFRRFLCLLMRTNKAMIHACTVNSAKMIARRDRLDTLGAAISGLMTQSWEIPLVSQVNSSERQKICESQNERSAEAREIDEWVNHFKRDGFNSVILVTLSNAFDQIHRLEVSYKRSESGQKAGAR